MSRLRLFQFAVVAGFIMLLEALCFFGLIDKVTMPPPHIIVRDLIRMILARRYFGEIGKSLANVLLAFGSAYIFGIVSGTILHSIRRRVTFSIRYLRRTTPFLFSRSIPCSLSSSVSAMDRSC